MTRVFTPWRRSAAVTALVLLLVVLLVWLARTVVFARLAEIYLLARGVPASIEITRLDWHGADASARLGARRTPDLAIQNIHAVFNGDWIPKVESIALSRVTLRVAFDGEKFSFGTLQRLVNGYTSSAPQAAPVSIAQGATRVVVSDAKVLAFTPAGVLSFAGSGVLSGSRVERFLGTIGRANLRSQGFAVLLSGGDFNARSAGNGLDLHLTANGRGLLYSRIRASEVRAALDVKGFDPATQRLASAEIAFHAQAINGPVLSAAQADIKAALGAWATDGAEASGPLKAVISFTRARAKALAAERVAFDLQSPTLSFNSSGVSGLVTAAAEIAGARYRFKTTSLALSALSSRATGDVRIDGAGFTGVLTASLASDFSMSRTDARKFAHGVPLLGDDARNVRAIVAALRGVKLDAPQIHIGKSSASLMVRLLAPITLQSLSGARAMIAQSGDVALSLDADGRMTGGFSASLTGRGLPTLDLRVTQYALRDKPEGLVLDSALAFSAKTSLRSFRDAKLLTNGHLKAGHGRYDYTPEGCAKLGLGAYLSNGKPSLSNLRTQICPLPRQPLLFSANSGWQVRGVWQNLTAALDSATARAASKSGHFEIAGNSAGLGSGFVQASNARITDAKPSPRFAPLLASGKLTLANAQWRGGIGFALARTKHKFAIVTVRHDTQTDSGEALIASDLAFAPDNFQPGEISPLLASLTQATGTAKFNGRIAWTAHDQTSGGTLDVGDADFNGPLGAVKQAQTRIVFTSLAPLATASAQALTAQKIEWLVPFAGLLLKFQLTEEAIRIESFAASAAGGHVSLGAMTVALDPKSTTSGTLVLDNVNLGALIAASNLAGKVSLDAPVSGEIPFRYGPAGLRIANGHFAATGPSRLSIRRTVWTGGEAAQTDAIRDFAYQALENLAIDALDASLNSLPAGRLGVVFHIKGRNDPPVAQETRLGIVDLIQGHAFDKPVPLPKGTPVDLTLDTSLNFDELLEAYRHAFSASMAEAAATSEQNEGNEP